MNGDPTIQPSYVSPPPAAEPVYQTESPRRRTLIIGLAAVGVLGLLLIGFFVVRAVFFDEQSQRTRQSEQQLSQSLRDCETASDPETCRRGVVESFAPSLGTERVCAALSGLEQDDCLWVAAKETRNLSVCNAIADSERTALCTDGVRVILAMESADATACDRVVSETRRQECLQAVLGDVTAGNCALLRDAEYCAYMGTIERAVSAQDRLICAEIDAESVRFDCEDAVSFDDPDFDGLETEEERRIGTDPRNPDTDGDGFLDGEEVQAGFDPLGPGRA